MHVCYSEHERLSLFPQRTKTDCSVCVGNMPAMEVMRESECQSVKLLSAVDDEFGGLNVEMAEQPMDAALFASRLRASISHWRQQVGSMLGVALQFHRSKV